MSYGKESKNKTIYLRTRDAVDNFEEGEGTTELQMKSCPYSCWRMQRLLEKLIMNIRQDGREFLLDLKLAPDTNNRMVKKYEGGSTDTSGKTMLEEIAGGLQRNHRSFLQKGFNFLMEF